MGVQANLQVALEVISIPKCSCHQLQTSHGDQPVKKEAEKRVRQVNGINVRDQGSKRKRMAFISYGNGSEDEEAKENASPTLKKLRVLRQRQVDRNWLG